MKKGIKIFIIILGIILLFIVVRAIIINVF